jgi:hypothetical protein
MVAECGKENFCLLMRSCAVRLLVFCWEFAQRIFFGQIAVRLFVFRSFWRGVSSDFWARQSLIRYAVRLFGLGTEESRIFSLKTRTGLRKDESNCNGEEVMMDDVRRGEGKGRQDAALCSST